MDALLTVMDVFEGATKMCEVDRDSLATKGEALIAAVKFMVPLATIVFS
ncbi:hypothetical protein [Paraburkholderia tropica]|nr:hypothetical protein [Paraburkholderia tropica]